MGKFTNLIANSPGLAPAEMLLVSLSPAFVMVHDDRKIFILYQRKGDCTVDAKQLLKVAIDKIAFCLVAIA